MSVAFFMHFCATNNPKTPSEGPGLNPTSVLVAISAENVDSLNLSPKKV